MHNFLSSLVKYIVALLELLLGIRLVLKFLGASERAMIVDWLYKISDVIVSPFDFIFSNIYTRQGMIDIVAISAIVGYFILTLIILKLLDVLFNKKLTPET